MLPLINRYTRFEILKSVTTMIVPVRWERRLDHPEQALGFRRSCVVRKTGKPTVDWPIIVASITKDMYPH